MNNKTQSNWTGVNIDMANSIWRGMNHKTLTDLYTQRFQLPPDPALGHAAGSIIESTTHCLSLSEIQITARLAAYDDAKGIFQSDLTRVIAPHEIAIGIKHHQPCPGKNIEVSADPVRNLVETVKFQATHITVAVGVEFNAPNGVTTPGVITLNNPQNYPDPDPGEIGLFGPREYPITWVRPEFPAGLAKHKVQAYIDNIRTWLVILNTVTLFPENSYNGGDPLGAISPDAIRYCASLALRSMSGDPEATKELGNPEHLVYCAELAYLALNIGTQVPLNKHTIEALGIEPMLIQREIVTKSFLHRNKNGKACLIKLAQAPEDLLAIHDEPTADINPVSPCKIEPFGTKRFAIQPQTLDCIVENFFERQFNRTELVSNFGEDSAAKTQAWVFRTIIPAIKLILEINRLRKKDCTLLEQTLNSLELKLGDTYGHADHGHEFSYHALSLAIRPEREALRLMSGPRGNGAGAFCMPANFLLNAEDNMMQCDTKGYLNFSVLAFSLHESILASLPDV